MAAATAITFAQVPGVYMVGSCTIDTENIGAGANQDNTIAVPEAKVGDIVIISPRATLLDGLVISQAGVFAAGTITFTIENHTAGALNQASTVFDFILIRGASGPLT